MNDRLFVDIHVIETLPPSCVNRDDLGSPKTAIYGGVTRARISSQAWKRAVRGEFVRMDENVGKRTKHICDLVAAEIRSLKPDASDPEAMAREAVEKIGIAFESKKDETKVLVFVSPAQARGLAEAAVKYAGKKADKKDFEKACLEAMNSSPSPDIALFGRMVAENPTLNADAAAQVAHAISTHEVHNEYDYFTAVDDYEGVVGAGHLGTTEFNSATMYRYAAVNALELNRQLEGEAPHVIRTFTEAFIRSMPTGKQNSFANSVRPDAVYVTVRCDQPVNMAGAFERPIRAGKDGYVSGSVKELVKYAAETYSDYYEKPALALTVGSGMEELGEKLPLSAMLDKLEAYLAQALEGKESE